MLRGDSFLGWTIGETTVKADIDSFWACIDRSYFDTIDMYDKEGRSKNGALGHFTIKG